MHERERRCDTRDCDDCVRSPLLLLSLSVCTSEEAKTTTNRTLSNGDLVRRAVVCITAFRKLCGLKKPDSQATFGISCVSYQSLSWLYLSIRLTIQLPSGRMDAKETDSLCMRDRATKHQQRAFDDK